VSEALPRFDLLRPRTVDEFIACRAQYPASRVLAGGTDLVVNMRRGLLEPSALVDVTGVEELRRLEWDDTGLCIGAGVTLAALGADERVRTGFAAVAQAAEAVAGPTHREAATVGGNLCQDTRCVYYNQSAWWRKAVGYCLKLDGDICHVAPQGKRCRAAFCSDLAPALMVHDAHVELVGPRGRRRIALTDLYSHDGAAHLKLAGDEMLAFVHLPARPWRSAYAKARVRDSIDFPLAGVAVSLHDEGTDRARLRVAATGVDSRPVLLEGVDEPVALPPGDAFLGRLDKLVQKQVTPMRTTTASSHYRRLAAAALARRLLVELAGDAGQ
jgi:4-hydroxybenzoyl-CoA reductase subunit beta